MLKKGFKSFSGYKAECSAGEANDGQWMANGNGELKINGKEPPNIFNYLFCPPCGENVCRRQTKGGSKGKGFTLAEVLITLVVIGIVAAITIPVLHSNTQGKEWNAAKQKARAGLGEAFKLASVNNDLETMSAKDYVKTVLPKYLKLAKTCDTAQECGFADYIKTPEGEKVSASNLNSWDTITQYRCNLIKEGLSAKYAVMAQGGYEDAPYKEAGYFQTVDGFSVSLLYNPNCRASDMDNTVQNAADAENQYKKYGITQDSSYGAVCFNAVYDMNGPKGPNTVGKDVGFAGSFYSGIHAKSAAVLPVPGGKYLTAGVPGGLQPAIEYCKSLNTDYDLPSVDEASLIFLNNSFVKNTNGYHFWVRSAAGISSVVRNVSFATGYRALYRNNSNSAAVRCVRADKLM